VNTPLTDAVSAYLAQNRARFHMPGHKGQLPLLGEAAKWDITEVDGCDSLFEASGAIAQTEAAYALLYGTAASLLSAGGATLCIQAMLALACPPGSELIAVRGAHASAVHTMALLDLAPTWVWPDIDPRTGLAGPVTAAQIGAALAAQPQARVVYLTSPDYFGQLCDIAAIADLCHKQGAVLLVDNAHGAHLRFCGDGSRHPIAAGADICCDSLHKTLPVLTGGALLHIGNPRYVAGAKKAMALFGSTSPSFLVLLSADQLLPSLAGQIPAQLAALAATVADLRNIAAAHGFLLPADPVDPVRLSLGFAAKGYGQDNFSAALRGGGFEPEYIDTAFCVLLPGICQPPEDFARLAAWLRTLPALAPPIRLAPVVPAKPTAACSLRAAVFSACESVAAAQADGRIAAAQIAPCPPGIPLIMPGERIDSAVVASLKKHGICRVDVVK
jgi:Arginine/lysine/ornithine decarboxylases